MGFKIKVPQPKIRKPIAPPSIRHKSEKDYDRKREKTDYKDFYRKKEQCPDCGSDMKLFEIECEECSGRAWVREGSNLIERFASILNILKIVRFRKYPDFRDGINEDRPTQWQLREKLEEILTGVT